MFDGNSRQETSRPAGAAGRLWPAPCPGVYCIHVRAGLVGAALTLSEGFRMRFCNRRRGHLRGHGSRRRIYCFEVNKQRISPKYTNRYLLRLFTISSFARGDRTIRRWSEAPGKQQGGVQFNRDTSRVGLRKTSVRPLRRSRSQPRAAEAQAPPEPSPAGSDAIHPGRLSISQENIWRVPK